VPVARIMARRRRHLLLAHRRDPREHPGIAVVPIATEAVSRQLVVIEPFAAKVSDGHSAAKMEERPVRTDADNGLDIPSSGFSFLTLGWDKPERRE
jgi:hypothetical protein